MNAMMWSHLLLCTVKDEPLYLDELINVNVSSKLDWLMVFLYFYRGHMTFTQRHLSVTYGECLALPLCTIHHLWPTECVTFFRKWVVCVVCMHGHTNHMNTLCICYLEHDLRRAARFLICLCRDLLAQQSYRRKQCLLDHPQSNCSIPCANSQCNDVV